MPMARSLDGVRSQDGRLHEGAMTNRDVLAGLGAAVVAIVALATVVVLLRERGEASRHAAAVDAESIVTEPTPRPPVEPEPEEHEVADAQGRAAAAPARGHDTALGTPSEAGVTHDSGAPTVLRAASLLIHPVGHEKLCVDYSTRRDALHLFSCHGRQNQRWDGGRGRRGCHSPAERGGGLRSWQGTTKEVIRR